jgi:hypothetical protein
LLVSRSHRWQLASGKTSFLPFPEDATQFGIANTQAKSDDADIDC